jgi:hypothetical protein
MEKHVLTLDRGSTELTDLGGSNDFWIETGLSALKEFGLIVTRGVLIAEMKQEFDSRATPFVHPDADPDGITTITPGAEDRGGFSRERLAPHTDRAMVEFPPSVLGLVMEQQGTEGGGAFFVDSLELVTALLSAGLTPSDIRDIRIQPYGTEPAVKMFEPVLLNRWVVRYRDDRVARPVSDSPEVIDQLLRSLEALAMHLPLVAGDGYVLNNRQWMHGRTKFQGPRRAGRLLYSTPLAGDLAPAVEIKALL